MSMVIELEGGGRKAGHVCSPDYRRGRGCPLIVRETSEDVLTANVFGVLRNLPPRLWLRPLLNFAFKTSRFSSVSMKRLDVSFWQRIAPPSVRANDEGWTEVDVLIRFDDDVVFIECKYRAGLSAHTTHDTQRDQLVRLLDCAWHYSVEGLCFPRKPPHVLVLGSELAMPELVRRYREPANLLAALRPEPAPTLVPRARIAAERIGYASWNDLATVVRSRLASSSAIGRLFGTDVVRYIEQKMATVKLDSAQRRQLSLTHLLRERDE